MAAFGFFARQCDRGADALGNEIHQPFHHPLVRVDARAGQDFASVTRTRPTRDLVRPVAIFLVIRNGIVERGQHQRRHLAGPARRMGGRRRQRRFFARPPMFLVFLLLLVSLVALGFLGLLTSLASGALDASGLGDVLAAGLGAGLASPPVFPELLFPLLPHADRSSTVATERAHRAWDFFFIDDDPP